MINNETIFLAKILWNYHKLNHTIKKSDLIFVFGSQSEKVAHKGIDLYHAGYAPKILFSGGIGRYTGDDQKFSGTTEADFFAKLAMERGINQNDIFIENKSTNTRENILHSYELIKDLGFQNIILVQKPYCERRALATFFKQWPGNISSLSITSPSWTFEDYLHDHKLLKRMINLIVGHLHRIIEYPRMGYQVYQEIPSYVMRSYQKLIELGFTNDLVTV